MIGLSPSGKATDFGSVTLGSNPSSPAISFQMSLKYFKLDALLVNELPSFDA